MLRIERTSFEEYLKENNHITREGEFCHQGEVLQDVIRLTDDELGLFLIHNAAAGDRYCELLESYVKEDGIDFDCLDFVLTEIIDGVFHVELDEIWEHAASLRHTEVEIHTAENAEDGVFSLFANGTFEDQPFNDFIYEENVPHYGITLGYLDERTFQEGSWGPLQIEVQQLQHHLVYNREIQNPFQCYVEFNLFVNQVPCKVKGVIIRHSELDMPLKVESFDIEGNMSLSSEEKVMIYLLLRKVAMETIPHFEERVVKLL